MSSPFAALPLFPLHAVLFPGGLLPLKIFEARYLDMTADCLRDQTPFGICLLKSGDEFAPPGRPAVPERVGCLAEIVACDANSVGLLMLQTRGTTRFRLLSHYTEADGLMRGIAEPIEPDPPVTGTAHLAKLAACAEVLERIIGVMAERTPGRIPFAPPFAFDDTSWVSNRLAEVLPIPMRTRQKFMALTDAMTRLDLVHHYMMQHQLL